jgi:hypothetical protein
MLQPRIKNVFKVELTIAQKWEIIEYSKKNSESNAKKFDIGEVRHCSASLKQHGKIIMPNMKEAIIRKAWKMVSNPYIGTGKKSGFRYRCRYDTETGYRHRIPDIFPVYTGTETGKPDLFPVSEILKSVFLKLYFN